MAGTGHTQYPELPAAVVPSPPTRVQLREVHATEQKPRRRRTEPVYDTWAPRPCWFRAVLTAEGFSHSPCRDWAPMQASPAARPLCRLAKKQTSSTAAARKRHIRPREDLQEAVHELTRSSAMDEKKLQRRLPCCRIGTIRAPAPLPVQRSGQYTAGYPAYLLQAQV